MEKGIEEKKGYITSRGRETIYEIHRKLIIHTWSLKGKCGINNLREKQIKKKKKGRMGEKGERKTPY